MRTLLVVLMFGLCACGQEVVRTEYVPICDGAVGPGSDAPAIMLPDEVVCNHAPAEAVEVVGNQIVYMCTKIQGE